MTFAEEFFGPGNRLTWAAIQAGSLPGDVQERLGPFLEELQRAPEVLVLPRVREDGQVQWYVLCSSARAARMARDEVRSFVGSTYCEFDGRPTRFDPDDKIEQAVLSHYGNNAFRLDVCDRAVIDVVRERLRLLVQLRKDRPARHGRRLRASGRVLRDFEYALLTGNDRAAEECIEELRATGQLNATNLLFLEVRRLAACGQHDVLLALPECDALLAMRRPRRVTEALIRAVYRSRLIEFEDGGRAVEAVERFNTEVRPRFGDLYRSRAGLSGYEVDVSFLTAAVASMPGRRDVADGILAEYLGESSQRSYLMKVAALLTPQEAPPEIVPLEQARTAFGDADIDRAFTLAVGLIPSFDRTALLLRCAREMGTLSAAVLALESVDTLSPPDLERLNRNTVLSRVHDTLRQLCHGSESTSVTCREAPTSWLSWLERLTPDEPWREAVSTAEIGAHEWDFESLAPNATAVQDLAGLLLADRPQWGQEALRDALPYLIDVCLESGADPRLKPLYESLFLLVSVDDQVSVPQVGTLLKIVEIRLRLSVSAVEYQELVRQLSSAILAVDTPAVVGLGLEAIEMLVNAACPVASERQALFASVATLFQRWYRRVDRGQVLLLRQFAEELGLSEVALRSTSRTDLASAGSEWDALSDRRVAFYSLRESVLRRVASVVNALCPGVRINVFSDHVGGSAALRTASATADIFVIATAAAKHAATTFIEAHRPRALVTLYANSQGSSGLLEVLREHLRSSLGAESRHAGS